MSFYPLTFSYLFTTYLMFGSISADNHIIFDYYDNSFHKGQAALA